MKFNRKTTGTKTVNLAGGEAFSENPKLELVTMLLTSFVEDKFYERKTKQLERLAGLVGQLTDKKFIAKAAIFARTEYGMRSITHALLAELARVAKGFNWLKNAIAQTMYRPDDMTEILAYYLEKYGKPIPNALKKGLALGINKFDAYQLAKYNRKGAAVKLVDILNLVHTKPNEKNKNVLADLIKGELKSADTWEVRQTKAGQAVQDIEDADEKETKLAELKKENWATLIKEKKLGYFALLRNLRNIENQAEEVLDDALAMLVDEKLIRKSLVLPFRFQTASKEIGNRKTKTAIKKALEISFKNVPKFDGKTLIVLDTSGSMEGKPKEIGALFAASLYKANDNSEFMRFADDARYITLDSDDSLVSLSEDMAVSDVGDGTDFHAIFQNIEGRYDRIIILSDMQGWMGYNAPTKEFADYKKKTGCNPKIYSFDLNGYGTLMFPENNVFCLAGFSEKVFDVIKLLGEDKDALISKIEAIKVD